MVCKCQISKWGQKEGDSNSCGDPGFGQRGAPARDDVNKTAFWRIQQCPHPAKKSVNLNITAIYCLSNKSEKIPVIAEWLNYPSLYGNQTHILYSGGTPNLSTTLKLSSPAMTRGLKLADFGEVQQSDLEFLQLWHDHRHLSKQERMLLLFDLIPIILGKEPAL